MIDYHLILIKNYANKQWIMAGDSYEGLDWHDESTKPTQSELDALWDSTLSQVENEKQMAETHRQNAIAKLTALGLTSDEISALGVK